MAVISKDLGAVTAYAAAVNRGYTGTKEEFETLMASYATVAQHAAESAGNASQSATDASQSAQNAETAKGTAQQAATDAQTAQVSAQESAQSAQQSAQSASQSATDAESAKNTAVDAVDGFAAGAQQALDGVNQAGNNWKSLAERQAENSEAYAIGTRNGEDVGSSDPAYHNNAKYYAESVSASAQTATEAAQTATAKASEAQASASAAAESARTLTIDKTLTQAGQAADAKETGDKIARLKENLTEEKQITENIYGEITWTDGFVTAKGSVTSSDTYKYSNKISVSQGDVISLPDTTKYIRWIAAYSDLSTAVEAKGSNNGVTTYTVPEGIKYVILTIPKSFGTIVINRTHTILVNNLVDEVAELQEAVKPLEGLAEIVTTEEATAIVVPVEIINTSGYVTPDGSDYSSSSYKYTSKIPALPGNIIKLYNESGTNYISSARFVTVYKNDVAVSALGGENVSLPYTVPDGADAIVVSYSASYGNATCEKTVITTETINSEKPRVDALYQILMSAEPNRFISKFNVSAGNTYTSDKELQDICGYRICFFAKVGTFSGITRIGKAETQPYGGAIGFDETNLYEYLGNISTASRTQTHGLTIKDYVGLVIDLHYNGETVVTLSTNGGSYTWTIPFWRSQYGQITVYSASALSDCVLSYTCEGILKETWLYGDSYFANTGNIRWTAYLISKGYSNFLLNAYPGRNSITALASLKTDLELGKVPKRIVWCLGMNDKDGESAPNASWKSSLDEVISICEQYNIELVLATIPNVPSTVCLNTYKNAYVKASGYRYIPFAEAISADESSTWYDGMLEIVSGGGYGIHPTEQGALCLFNCAVSAVPELLW